MQFKQRAVAVKAGSLARLHDVLAHIPASSSHGPSAATSESISRKDTMKEEMSATAVSNGRRSSARQYRSGTLGTLNDGLSTLESLAPPG